jgi:hypothetical protein
MDAIVLVVVVESGDVAATHQKGAAMLESAVDQAVEPIKLDLSPDDLALDPHLEIAPTQCRRGQAHERPVLHYA